MSSKSNVQCLFVANLHSPLHLTSIGICEPSLGCINSTGEPCDNFLSKMITKESNTLNTVSLSKRFTINFSSTLVPILLSFPDIMWEVKRSKSSCLTFILLDLYQGTEERKAWKRGYLSIEVTQANMELNTYIHHLIESIESMCVCAQDHKAAL